MSARVAPREEPSYGWKLLAVAFGLWWGWWQP